jgi:hypothetical protein
MGKRSQFPRIERDNYETPAPAVEPLLPHLKSATRFVEPCCGAGILAGHLKRAGHVLVGAFDLPVDATSNFYDIPPGVVFITNPPLWGRRDLFQIIRNLSDQAPTWLLMSGDWLFNASSGPFMPRARVVVAIGRVKWIPDSKFTGKDNAAWFKFTRPSDEPTIFIGRTARTSPLPLLPLAKNESIA